MNIGPITLLIGRFKVYISSMSFQIVNAQIWWPIHRKCGFIDCCSIGERKYKRRNQVQRVEHIIICTKCQQNHELDRGNEMKKSWNAF